MSTIYAMKVKLDVFRFRVSNIVLCYHFVKTEISYLYAL